MPTIPAASLGDTAVAFYAPHHLKRGGPHGRALKLRAGGAAIDVAANTAAIQGKGHVGELSQAAHLTTRSGALGRTVHARPNRVANDPLVDVELLRGGRRVGGSQVKVVSPQSARRAVRKRPYAALVVNAEALEALEGLPHITDRLTHGELTAPQLRADEAHGAAADSLTRMLLGEAGVGGIDVLVTSARAGLTDGIVSFAIGLATDVVNAAFQGEELDLRAAVRAALGTAARAAIRTAIEVAILVQRFLESARGAFSARLLHRIASSRIAVSAIAEVIMETSLDFLAVLRNELTFEGLLRRFGVHVTTATGAALGVALGVALTAGMPVWLTLIAAVLGGYVGSQLGRHMGEQLFMHAVPAPILLPQRTGS